MEVEQAIKEKGVEGIHEYWEFLKSQLNKTVTLVRQKLTKMQTITINALIVIDVHARDVMEKLVNEKVSINQIAYDDYLLSTDITDAQLNTIFRLKITFLSVTYLFRLMMLELLNGFRN